MTQCWPSISAGPLKPFITPFRHAVTDPQCRVRGIDALRVVDASIMPSIPQAMTNAAVPALAERAADLIRCIEG